MNPAIETAPAPVPRKQMHPPGLRTLFFTEMWERFSYYGMRALLVLFMVDAARGGLGMPDATATAIYGLYSAGVYLMALPGGWLGDRLLGSQRAVWWGGVVIALGHFSLAVPRNEFFYLGLVLVAVGSGILKSNISALVGQLYPEGGARRDAGFTIFYMGVNLGAAIGPLVCSFLGERLNWHYGFGAAGVGMLIGLAQFRWTRSRLGDVGIAASSNEPLGRLGRMILGGTVAAFAVVAALAITGRVVLDPIALARGSAGFILAVAVLFFASVFFFRGLTRTEKQRTGVILVLFVSSAIFWAGFEQMGSSFNLFAERHTDRVLESIQFTIPTGWFQSLGPVFIIVFAPVFAALWVRLGARHLNPSLPLKFAFGLVFLALGFLVMAGAARIVAGGGEALPTWLMTTYLLHTFGELCLSPVGLSSVTKLAPPRLVGQMMGSWFLATSLGSLIAGLLAGRFSSEAPADMPRQFLEIAWMPLGAAALLILFRGRIKRWMAGVE